MLSIDQDMVVAIDLVVAMAVDSEAIGSPQEQTVSIDATVAPSSTRRWITTRMAAGNSEEGLRVGGSNVGRLGNVINNRKSGNDGGTVGNRTATRKGSGSALLARMLFDKENRADRKQWCNGGEREGCMIAANLSKTWLNRERSKRATNMA